MNRPQLPEHLVYRTYRTEATAAMVGRALSGQPVDGNDLVAALGAALAPTRNPEHAAAEREYNRQATEYNAHLQAQRDARTRRVQAKANAAEVAKVRNAACTRCFSTHAGEC